MTIEHDSTDSSSDTTPGERGLNAPRTSQPPASVRAAVAVFRFMLPVAVIAAYGSYVLIAARPDPKRVDVTQRAIVVETVVP